MVCIILLNWNGCQDTMECLRSLDSISYEDYFVIVGDNGSSDQSLDKLEKFCLLEKRKYEKIVWKNEGAPFEIQKRLTILYDLQENHGFSKGNNLILEYAYQYHPNYYLLLNNDTIVESDFLTNLVNFQCANPTFKVLTPLIHYFYDKNLIWNGGGNIYWGFRKYHYMNKNSNMIREKEYILCTYITGCALFFLPALLMQNQHIFTEKFFFGEEDFELGLRLKRMNISMACVVNSRIYHKVGASRKRKSSKIGHAYIHYLNRLMDVRDYMNSVSYFFYRIIFFLNVALKMKYLYALTIREVFKFIKMMNSDIKSKDCVSKEYSLAQFSKLNFFS